MRGFGRGFQSMRNIEMDKRMDKHLPAKKGFMMGELPDMTMDDSSDSFF